MDEEKEVIEKEYAKRTEYISLFSGELGRKILNDLIANHCVLSATFSSDPYRTAFNEGQRNVVLRILNMIIKNPSDLLDRVREIEAQMKKHSEMERAMNDYG